MNNLTSKSDLYQFNVNLDVFEGPLDLLLELARTQKVDLSKISILKLADQYLEYINYARTINLETASDYLVMAAWLTFLKSKLLLPKDQNDEEPSAHELEEALKFQLKRLETMQNVAKRLYDLPQVDIDIFYRGYNDGVKYKYKIHYTSELYDLLKAYTSQLNRIDHNTLKIELSHLHSVDQAIERLKVFFGNNIDWIEFSKLLPSFGKNILINKSAKSSTFVASLELVKNNIIKLKQDTIFGPIYYKIK